MGILAALPPILASAAPSAAAAAPAAGGLTAAGATAVVPGAVGATAGGLVGAGGAALGGSTASLGSILGGTTAATSILGTAATLTQRPKKAALPPTPQAPQLSGSFSPSNTSAAATNPGSILGGTFTSPAAAGATTYGKTALGG